MKSLVRHPLVIVVLITVLACYAFFGLEWLFFVTKPSLLSYVDWQQKLTVLITAPLPLVILTTSLSVILFPASRLVGRFMKEPASRINFVLLICPVFVLASLQFILIENFSYTIFSVGTSTFSGAGRLIPAAIFLALICFNLGLLISDKTQSALVTGLAQPVLYLCLLLILSSIAVTILSSDNHGDSVFPMSARKNQDSDKRYNVLIFSSDGMDADSMSAYGYERRTTPFIESLLDESLVFENHFTNSAKTTSSVGALLSTKHPTTTRVIFRPDIFTQIHSFQHLPGYLRQFGYVNGDESIRHYVDAYDVNLRESFHYANGRDPDSEGLPLPSAFRQRLTTTSLFLETVYLRFSSRLLHTFGIRTMYNPFLAVTQPDPVTGRSNDRDRLDRIKQFMANAKGPFFANVHFMNTHGRFFSAENTRFTGDRTQNKSWDRDFYDNAILGYDNYTREIVEFLKQEGLYDNTLLILNTDHGFKWGYQQPLPLIIRFPDGYRKGVVKSNSQRIDIAPTIVEYLGLDIPDWMEGDSLIDLERSSMEPIYVVNRQKSGEKNGWRIVSNPRPPFYTLGGLYVIYCDRIFELDLIGNEFSKSDIKGHTARCDESDFPDDIEVRKNLVNLLAEKNYDVSSLPIPNSAIPDSAIPDSAQ